MEALRTWRKGCLAFAIATLGAAGAGTLNADDRTHSGASGMPCESLASLALPDTTITVATTVPAGVNPVPAPPGPGAFQGVLAAPICRVAGTIKPTVFSNIRFEVFLPVSGWNGKFNGVGNGGLAGFIAYDAMQRPLNRGYATASTDTGHQAHLLDGSWMLGNPELLVDFASRAHHLTAQAGKAIVRAYYGRKPRHAYFTGCSNGGEQALSEAQRFPDDYDGIVAGAPANYPTRLWPAETYYPWVIRSAPVEFLSKMPALRDAAVAACDAVDGLVDGQITDPRKCSFDPAAIQCTAGDNASCLTAEQVGWARKVYAGLPDPRSGKQIWPGYEVGSEAQWGGILNPGPLTPPLSYFKFLIYENPSWSFKDPGVDFESSAMFRDIYGAEREFGPVLNAIDPDLRAFKKRGGKLILWHGWNDQNIAPRNTISYYEQVVEASGGRRDDDDSLRETRKFARLFMAPGMQHCNGGPGPNTFDMLTALEQWVEQGVAPKRIIASHSTAGVVDRTRPLCPYPAVAVYRGSGSIDDAANFVCRAPRGEHDRHGRDDDHDDD